MAALPTVPLDHTKIAEFLAFVEAAKKKFGKLNSSSRKESSVSEFSKFIALARPLVASEIRNTLHVRRESLFSLSRWLIPPSADILSAAGLSGLEDPYTNLIAWMMWPDQQPTIALKIQKAWLNALGFNRIATSLVQASKPETQFVALDRCRPDMVLRFEASQFVLIVEAKTGSEEHETSDGGWQTESYPKAVRDKLGLGPEHHVAMAFLTPDGREAASSEAIVTTYQTLVTAIANAVSPGEFAADLRFAFANVISHLLSYACPGGLATVECLLQIEQYLGSDSVHLNDDRLLENIHALGPLSRIVRNGAFL